MKKKSNLKNLEHEKKLRNIFERLHILNDFLSALFFIIGSIFFFYPSRTYDGTWLFLIGSCQLIIGPFIRILDKLHTKHLDKSRVQR